MLAKFLKAHCSAHRFFYWPLLVESADLRYALLTKQIMKIALIDRFLAA